MKGNKQLKLGIVGHGFVGKATDWGFNKNVERFIVDPKLNTSISDLSKFKPDIIFICVPTPMGNDGNQDASILKSVAKELISECSSSIKVIKSTVLPSTLNDLEKLDHKLIYNPEFLREKHANEDFINSKFLILEAIKMYQKWSLKHTMIIHVCVTKDHIFTDIETASLIKYSINTFFSFKGNIF